MRKKTAAVLFVCVWALFMAGCETAKGLFTGAADGARKDWEAAKRMDKWMQENLW